MKKPRPGGGVFGMCDDDEAWLARAKSEVPGRGPFLEMIAHEFVIINK